MMFSILHMYILLKYMYVLKIFILFPVEPLPFLMSTPGILAKKDGGQPPSTYLEWYLH